MLLVSLLRAERLMDAAKKGVWVTGDMLMSRLTSAATCEGSRACK